MTFVPVPAMESTIEPRDGGYVVTLRNKRPIFPLLFLPVWLVGWVFGEVSALRELLSSSLPLAGNGFLLFWLTGWTLGGAWAWITFLWMLRGREELTFAQGMVTWSRTIFGLGPKESFDLQHATGWRVSPLPFGGQFRGMAAFGRGALGTITFDYGSRTVRCGGGVDEGEARLLIDRLSSQGLLPKP